MFTGGALSNLSICSLNIMPYITASIMMQLMGMASETIAAIKKEGATGRQKLNQYTRYLTIVLAALQGYGIALSAEGLSGVVINPGVFFRVTAVVSLIGGTMFVMWIGEQISTRGVGNGSSIVIFTGIVANLPRGFVSLFEMGRSGILSPFAILVFVSIVAALVYFIIFVEQSQRRIPIHYHKRQRGNKIYSGETTYLPFKLNTSGVIPPIFASALLMFPTTLMNFATATPDSSSWKQFVAMYLSHGKPLYILMYVLLITAISFFYSFVVFNCEETAENLRKNGAIILGRRPGSHTAEYFEYLLVRLTVLGAAYLSIVCIVPEVITSQYSVPLYLGGTSILIVVNVVIDTMTHVQASLLESQYEAVMKKSSFRRR